MTLPVDSRVADQRLAELIAFYDSAKVDCDVVGPCRACDALTCLEELQRLRLSATASEQRIAELVAKYETEDPIKPTASELRDWLGGECARAVRAYRTRLNCGLRQAVDAMKEATP